MGKKSFKMILPLREKDRSGVGRSPTKIVLKSKRIINRNYWVPFIRSSSSMLGQLNFDRKSSIVDSIRNDGYVTLNNEH